MLFVVLKAEHLYGPANLRVTIGRFAGVGQHAKNGVDDAVDDLARAASSVATCRRAFCHCAGDQVSDDGGRGNGSSACIQKLEGNTAWKFAVGALHHICVYTPYTLHTRQGCVQKKCSSPTVWLLGSNVADIDGRISRGGGKAYSPAAERYRQHAS